MVTRQGVLFPQGQLLYTGGTEIYYEPNSPKIVWFTLFAFTTAQYSTLFGYFSTYSSSVYISLMLNNGYLRIESQSYSSGAYPQSNVHSSSSTMFKIGWNLVWCDGNGSNYFLYGFPNFATHAISYSVINTVYILDT